MPYPGPTQEVSLLRGLLCSGKSYTRLPIPDKKGRGARVKLSIYRLRIKKVGRDKAVPFHFLSLS